jgi:hypothetical protein
MNLNGKCRRILVGIYRNLPVIRELLKINYFLREIRKTVVKLQQRVVAMEAIKLEFALTSTPRFSDPRRLLLHATQVCSQNGEDGMIREIFRRIGRTNNVFAEIGVEDGAECNTAFLLSTGWTGYWFDASDEFLPTIGNRTDLNDGCIKGVKAFVTRENVVELFEKSGVPKDLDILSIDVDQNTFYIWEALREWPARVVVVEYNSTIPPDLDWKVHYNPNRAWDLTQNLGASLKAFEILGVKLGYSLVGCDFIGVNAFFVRNDLLGNHFAEPFTAENHYEPPRYPFLSHHRGHPSSILDRAGEPLSSG